MLFRSTQGLQHARSWGCKHCVLNPDLHVDRHACCTDPFNSRPLGIDYVGLTPHFWRIVGVYFDGRQIVVSVVWGGCRVSAKVGIRRMLPKVRLYFRAVYEAICFEDGNTQFSRTRCRIVTSPIEFNSQT